MSFRTFVRLIIAMVCLSFLRPTFALAVDVPQSFTLDGKLFSDAAGTTPLQDSAIAFTIQILDDAKLCVVYEESQSVSTAASKGYFTVQVGTPVGSLTRTAGDSGNTMAGVFQNVGVINGKLLSNGAPCTVPAIAGQRRYVRIKILPSSMAGGARTLSPDLTIDSVPNAIVAERAESLQGLRASNVLQVNNASGSQLTQSNLESLFTSTTRFNSLSAVVDGTSSSYMRTNSTSGAQLPVMAGAPSSPTPGSVWFDSSDSKMKFQTSVGPVTIGNGAGTVTSVGFTAPAELSVAGAPVNSSGTIAVTWATQTANKVFAAPDAVTGTPTFRVMVANDIPNLPWTKITSLLPTTLLGYGITDAVRNLGGTPSFESGLNAAKGAATTAGRIWISTDTREIYRDNGATWDLLGTSASGTVTSVSSANNYLTVTNGTTTPSLTVNVGTVANTVAAGNDARITGALQQATAFSGDVTGVYSATSVDRIRGTGVSITALGTGNFLRYNGTNWVNTALSLSDVTTGLGYTPVNRAGDTMTGLLVLSADPSANLGASTKQYVDSAVATASTSANTYSDTKFITRNLPAAPGAGQNGQSVRWNNGSNVWEYYTAGSGGGDFMASGSVPMTGALVNNTNSASAAVAVTQSGAGHAATFMGGNVGIGTTNPTVALDVGSKTDAIRLPSSTTANRPASPAVGMIRYNTDNGKMEAYIGASWQDMATSATGASYLPLAGGTMSGNLAMGANNITGVGNITGTAAMQVSSGFNTALTLTAPGTGNVNFNSGTGGFNFETAQGVQFQVVNGPSSTVNYLTARGAATTNTPTLAAVGSDANINITLVPKGTGNVGIGTTTPAYKLDVNGPVNATSFYFNGTLFNPSFYESTIAATGGAVLTVQQSATNAATGARGPLYLQNLGTGGPFELNLAGANAAGGLTSWIRQDGGGYFATNVGIGTTTPSTTLDVNGAQTFRGVAAASAPPTAAQGKIYFDSTANKFKVSENNGAYVDLVGGGGTVTSVSSANSYLSVATGTTTPSLTVNVGTAANTVAAGNDSRITGALQQATAFSGDVTGVYSATSVDRIRGTGVSITALGTGNFLRYNGTNWVNTALSLSDVTTGLGYTPVNRAGDTMTGLLVLSADPSANLGAATKQYIDSSTATAATAANTYSDTKFITRNLPAAPGAGQNGQSVRWNNGSNVWEYYTAGTGGGDFMANGTVPMTAALRMAGNTINGNSTASGTLTLDSTSNATKGNIVLAPSGGNVGIANTNPANAKLEIGTAGSSLGTMRLAGSTSGYVQIQPAVAAGSWTMTLPATAGTSGQALTTNGSGVTSWSTVPANGGTFLAGDGSFAAPSISFSSDTNTGFYSHAADTVGVTSSGDTTATFGSGGINLNRDVSLMEYDGTTYASTGATAFPESTLMRITNTDTATSRSSQVQFTVRNSSGDNTAYMGAVSLASGYAPAIVFGQQTGAGSYAERMRIDAAGYVGIGTTSPTSSLHIVRIGDENTEVNITNSNAGASTETNFSATTNAGSIVMGIGSFANSSGDSYIHSTANTSMIFATNNSERMRIFPNGNVGIGTADPDIRLRVVAGAGENSSIGIKRTNNVTDGARMQFQPDGAVSPTNVVWDLGMPENSNSFMITGWDGAAATASLVVTNTGFVGIGTGAPGSALDVVGEINATNGDISTNHSLRAGDYDSGRMLGFGGWNNFVGGDDNSNFVTLGTSGIRRLTIDSSGHVGIGVTAPQAALDVVSTGTSSAVIVPRATTGNRPTTLVNGMIRYNTTTSLFEFYQNGVWRNYTVASDGRLKSNVVPVSQGLDIVNKLNPVFFDWDQNNPRAQGFGTKHQVGFIAQEVEMVLPEVVDQGADTYRTVEYGNMVAVAIAAIKELYNKVVGVDREVASLKVEKADKVQVSELAMKTTNEKALQDTEIQKLKKENLELKARLDKIEKTLNSK